MMTLVTDASFAEPGVAGWGAWARADGTPASKTDGGIIDLVRVQTNNEAEIAAAVYGLHMAVNYAPGHDVLLQSDSLYALTYLRNMLNLRESPHADGLQISYGNGRQRPCTETSRVLIHLFGDVMRKARIRVLLRHVKGHVEGAKGRHWCNEACDRGARQWMQRARALKAQGHEPAFALSTVESRR